MKTPSIGLVNEENDFSLIMSSGYSSTAHARLVSPTADRPERRRGVQSRVRRVTYAQDPSTTSSNQLDSSSQTTGSSPRVEESEPTAARAHHGYLEPVGFSHAQHIQRYLARKAMCIKSIMHDFEKVDIQELPTAERGTFKYSISYTLILCGDRGWLRSSIPRSTMEGMAALGHNVIK